MYNRPVDYEQLLALKPDIVFTSEGITPLDVAARLITPDVDYPAASLT